MSELDKNRIFFDLINYVFSEQMNVDWIFKTSLIQFTGLNTTLSQKSYEVKSLVNDIIDYVYDVKPYHVQFERINERYTVPTDVVEIEAKYESDIKIYDLNMEVIGYITTEGSVVINDVTIGTVEATDDWWYGPIENSLGSIIGSINEKGQIIINNTVIGRILEKYVKTNDRYYITETLHLTSVDTEPSKEAIEAFKNGDEDKYKELAKNSLADCLYLYKTQNLDDIYHLLDGNFKGTEIDGLDFFNERLRMGYDSFLYDSMNYDGSTNTNSYYMINRTVSSLGSIPHTMETVKLGTSLLNFDYTGYELTKNNLLVKSIYNGTTSTVYDYSINLTNNHYSINLFRNMKKNELIEIIVNTNECAFVFNCISFTEENSDGYNKVLKNIDGSSTYSFDIPYGDLPYKEVLVYRQRTKEGYDDSVKPFTYFTRNKKTITIQSSYIADGDIFSISVIDYKLIYDKIYNDEDINGFSNNVPMSPNAIELNPKTEQKNFYLNNQYGGFLRPLYEKNHPAELNYSSLIETNIIYMENTEKTSVYILNYMGNQMKKDYLPSETTKLQNDFLFENGMMSVADGTKLESPTTKDNGVIIPGRIIINSEIIEYYSKSGDILSNLRRACGGTTLNTYTIPKDTVIYPYNKDNWKVIHKVSPEICYNISDSTIKEYLCPYGVTKKAEVRVYRKPLITLESDIKLSSSSFLISTNNVELPISEEYGKLNINGDEILFKTIEKVSDTQYKISDFFIQKEYYMEDNPIILSATPIIVDDKKYIYNKKSNSVTLSFDLDEGEQIIVFKYSIDKKESSDSDDVPYPDSTIGFYGQQLQAFDNGVFLF